MGQQNLSFGFGNHELKCKIYPTLTYDGRVKGFEINFKIFCENCLTYEVYPV
jgi:hypothetical protein